MAWTYTASTHSSGNRNLLELTAGTTENDLSGLIGMTGVTHYINENHLNVYEIDATTRVSIRGTLYHDPDTEILILRHTNTGLSTGNASTAMTIDGSSSNRAFYYYGTTRTNSTRGTSTNSKSTGLIFAGARISNWHPNDAIISGTGNHETFVGRGGVILTARPCTGSHTLDVIGTTWRGITSSLEWRNPFGNANSSFDGTFDGVAVLLPAFNATFNFANSSIGEVINVLPITYHTLREFDVSQNINDYDIGSDGLDGRSHREHEIINSATGTDVIKMWRNTRGNTGQRGVVVTKKEVSFNFKDVDANNIAAVKLYLEDNPSSYAKNAVFVKSKSYDTVNGYASSGDSPITRGTVNANGDMVYDYTTSEVYQQTADASGDIAAFEVLTGVQIHEYNANDPDAALIYNIYIRANNNWAISSTDLRGPIYSDWDTANFGDFYRVDRRSDSNTNADDFTFKFCSYKHSLSSSTQILRGLGVLNVNWVLFDDLTITESDKAIVDAYTELETAQKVYDAFKSEFYDNYAGEFTLILDRQGNQIDLDKTATNLVIDATASSVRDLTGTVATIKASTYTGGALSTGSSFVTTLNGALLSGGTFDCDINYQSGAGTTITNVTCSGTVDFNTAGTYTINGGSIDEVTNSSGGNITLILTNGATVTTNTGPNITIEDVKNVSITGIVNGSRVQVYNVTTSSEFYNDIPGTSLTTTYNEGEEITTGDEIRIRVAYQSGVTAKTEFVTTALATASGVSALVSQVDNEVYNEYGVDGSTITEFTWDNPNLQVDINDADNTTQIQRIAAWYSYYITTADGIANLFGCIDWEKLNSIKIDVSICNLELDNTKTAPLFIGGGRIYHSDGSTVIASTSNSIQLDYDPVYVTAADPDNISNLVWGSNIVGADNGNGSAGEVLENIPKIIARKSDL